MGLGAAPAKHHTKSTAKRNVRQFMYLSVNGKGAKDMKSSAPFMAFVFSYLHAWRQKGRLVAVGELVVRAQHVLDLLLVHVDHVVASHLAILARIEVVRMLRKSLTHTGCVSQTRV